MCGNLAIVVGLLYIFFEVSQSEMSFSLFNTSVCRSTDPGHVLESCRTVRKQQIVEHAPSIYHQSTQG